MNWTSSTAGDMWNSEDNMYNFMLDTANTITASTYNITYNEWIDWIPKSCKWKKYIPTWHLVRSYR